MSDARDIKYELKKLDEQIKLLEKNITTDEAYVLRRAIDFDEDDTALMSRHNKLEKLAEARLKELAELHQELAAQKAHFNLTRIMGSKSNPKPPEYLRVLTESIENIHNRYTEQHNYYEEQKLKIEEESEKIKEESEKRINDFDVVISGGGPVALASALEAIKAGKSVAILSNRDIHLENTSSYEQKTTSSRGQRIFLDEQSRYYLLKMFPEDFRNNPDDVKFLDHLTTDITIRVRDIERFLYRRIIDEQRKANNASIEFINRKQIKYVDMQQGKVILEGSAKALEATPRELGFQYLIGADGVGHHAADKLNENRKKAITHQKIPSPKHPYHASISVHISRNDKKPLKLPKNQFIEVATKVNGESLIAGVSLNRKKGQSNTVKCVFGGEVPEHLFNEIKRYNSPTSTLSDEERDNIKKAVTDHMKLVMAKELDVKPEEINIDFRIDKKLDPKKTPGISARKYTAFQETKTKLSMQAFTTNLYKADKAYYEENDKKFLLAGDAYRSPNYQFGHGLNHAFRHAQFMGEVFSNKIDCKQYDKRCDKLSKEIEVANSFLNKLGKYGDKILLKAGNERPDRVRKKFSNLKNPHIIGIIEPLFEYLNSASLLSGHKSSAKKLLGRIKESDQRPWDVLNAIDKELYKINHKFYLVAFGREDYKKMLEGMREAAITAYELDVQKNREKKPTQIKHNVLTKSHASVFNHSLSEKKNNSIDDRMNDQPKVK